MSVWRFIVLALALLGPAPASAALTDDVTAMAPDGGSVAEAPTEALPDLPGPVEAPDVPKVPAPVPLPSTEKPPLPTPPPPATDSAGGPAHGLGGEAKERVVGSASEAEVETGAFPGTGSGVEPRGQAGARRVDGGSIGPAETAPLMRWRAYVWPAVALRIRDALAPLLASLDGLAAARLSDLFGLSSPSPSIASDSAGNGLPAERSGQLGEDLRSPVAALSKEGMSLLAALLIGLLVALGGVALARLVVGEELFEARHWRGHRG